MANQTYQYRMWIASAIDKARKSPSKKISYASVSPRLDPNTAFSYMQWAMAEGWLHCDNCNVYETRRTQGAPMSEVIHDINNRKFRDLYGN